MYLGRLANNVAAARLGQLDNLDIIAKTDLMSNLSLGAPNGPPDLQSLCKTPGNNAKESGYLVSAIVSTYKSERFIRGCLEDLEAQTIAEKVEIIVIDSASPENEGSIVQEFQQRYPNIVYIRTAHRETVYAAWNRGIKAATGKYITNANTDDRHRHDCFEVLAGLLESQPDKALAYGDVYVTQTPNETFTTPTITGEHSWLDYHFFNLLRRCEVGPQPMWRRTLHEELGYFDERYEVAGDYDFWLRVSEKYDFIHTAEKLGLYLAHSGSLEWQSAERTYYETQEVRTRSIERFRKLTRYTRAQEEALFHKSTSDLAVKLAEFKTHRSNPKLHSIELDFSVIAHLLYKWGAIDAAKGLCEQFFTLFGESTRLVTIFRKLLLDPRPAKHSFSAAPLISVIIPLYNQGKYLSDAIESVVNQSYRNWEVIIVNDGSTDDSLFIAQSLKERFSNHPITLLDQPNRGKGVTRNNGVKASSGKYVCVLDADDQIASTYLETAAHLLEHNHEIGWITPKTLQFGRHNQIFYHFNYDFIVSLLVCPSPVSAIFRRSLWDELGGYLEDMTDREDWEFWIRAGEKGWVGKTTEKVEFLYRIQYRRFGERPEINFKSKLEIVDRHPWWYRKVDETERQQIFYHSVAGSFPANFLEPKTIAKVQPHLQNRANFIEAVESIKASSSS